jgi:hypothetical protein
MDPTIKACFSTKERRRKMLGVCHNPIKRAAKKPSYISMRDPALRVVPIIVKNFVFKNTEFKVIISILTSGNSPHFPATTRCYWPFASKFRNFGVKKNLKKCKLGLRNNFKDLVNDHFYLTGIFANIAK